MTNTKCSIGNTYSLFYKVLVHYFMLLITHLRTPPSHRRVILPSGAPDLPNPRGPFLTRVSLCGDF